VGYDYVPYGVYGYWRRRYGVIAIPHTTVTHGTELGVFEGPHRIDVPTTYQALGDDAGYERLEDRIRSNRTLGDVGYAVALTGVAASVIGLFEMDTVRTWHDEQFWGTITGGGVGLMLGGAIGGAIPAGRASRLQYDHELSFDVDTLQKDFADHNAQLASQLGLSQTEAAELERR